jgi:DNA polymerase (family 10)
MENTDVARIFEQIADLLEIQGANQFRVRAYRNGARTIASHPQPLAQLSLEAIDALPGIGKDLAGKIGEVFSTGRLAFLDELRKAVPATLCELLLIPGLGPKRVKQIWETIGVASVDELERALADGRLDDLPHFGDKLRESVRKGIEAFRAHQGRVGLQEADAQATALREWLAQAPGVEALEVAGSWRRRRETVGDLDILVASTDAPGVMERFVSYPSVAAVLAKGETRSAVRLMSGLQVDLRLVPKESWGTALHYFTGSKAHNVRIRAMGKERGLKINEYGIFRDDERIGGAQEEDVYKAVGLRYIPPELREDRGEIEAVQNDRLPALVTLEDIRGDLQMHTTATDGKNALREMVEACQKLGHEYVAITDHTAAVRVAGGLGPDAVKDQFREIDRLQPSFPKIRILKSAEVDILEDGTLDLPDEVLALMDVVLAAVHSHLSQPRDQMTRRIGRALRHPLVHILAHPTGRLINRREPYDVDLAEVMHIAREEGVLLEVDAHPERLDLNDVNVRLAKEAGLRVVISSDAHRADDLRFLRYGVDQARRGWIEKKDVANTLPLDRFLRCLKPRPRSARAERAGGTPTEAIRPRSPRSRATGHGAWRRARRVDS